MNVKALQDWLNHFPDNAELKFSINGGSLVWTGGNSVIHFPFERGDFIPVKEVVTLEFKYGLGEVP